MDTGPEPLPARLHIRWPIDDVSLPLEGQGLERLRETVRPGAAARNALPRASWATWEGAMGPPPRQAARIAAGVPAPEAGAAGTEKRPRRGATAAEVARAVGHPRCHTAACLEAVAAAHACQGWARCRSWAWRMCEAPQASRYHGSAGVKRASPIRCCWLTALLPALKRASQTPMELHQSSAKCHL
jgi:hypothetical protein